MYCKHIIIIEVIITDEFAALTEILSSIHFLTLPCQLLISLTYAYLSFHSLNSIRIKSFIPFLNPSLTCTYSRLIFPSSTPSKFPPGCSSAAAITLSQKYFTMASMMKTFRDLGPQESQVHYATLYYSLLQCDMKLYVNMSFNYI